MANFGKAIAVVFSYDLDPRDRLPSGGYRDGSGYVDDPEDPGGLTVWGISRQYLARPECREVLGIVDLSRESLAGIPQLCAEDWYRRFPWLTYSCEKLLDDVVATKYFDCVVNMGNGGVRVLQQACNALGAGLLLDGMPGPLTIASANAADARALVRWMGIYQFQAYVALCARNQALRKFLSGWKTRATWPGA